MEGNRRSLDLSRAKFEENGVALLLLFPSETFRSALKEKAAKFSRRTTLSQIAE